MMETLKPDFLKCANSFAQIFYQLILYLLDEFQHADVVQTPTVPIPSSNSFVDTVAAVYITLYNL